MPLPAPELDNRTSQSIVDEAKRMIPRFCPDWTDHNVSDPGVTLIELFAWMTELLIYRVNQVPAKNYIKFLELLGLKLRPPRAARADLTFYLTAPLDQIRDTINVPAGITQAATARTETKPAVVFTTLEDLDLRSPQLLCTLTDSRKTGIAVHDLGKLSGSESSITMFSGTPVHQRGDREEGDAFHLVFANDLGRHVISLDLKFKRHEGVGGVTLGVTPDNPPRQWQVWAGEELQWMDCPLEKNGDGTRGFTRDGEIRLRLPAMEFRKEHNLEGFWLRCLLTQPKAGQSPYLQSPALIDRINVATLGGTIRAENYSVHENEILGVSDGTPGQKFRFSQQPLLERMPGETLNVIAEPLNEPRDEWIEVKDFGSSDKTSPHYVIDDLSGELSFGPALLQPDGNLHCYGKVPPRGAQLRFTRYRFGGGTAGNVAAEKINVLKTAPPYIERVVNWEPATGGRDAESLEQAILRIPAELRSHERAVTADDFEYHAKNVPGVADAFCVAPGRLSANGDAAHSDAPRPGQVRMYLLPQLGETNHPRFDQIKLDEHIRTAVLAELQKRCVLGISVSVHPVQVVGVSVTATLVSQDRERNVELKKQATEALERFLNPYTGGPQGKGWRQVSVLHRSDIYRLLLNLPLVERVENVFMRNHATNEPIHTSLELGQIVVCSGEHKIEVV